LFPEVLYYLQQLTSLATVSEEFELNFLGQLLTLLDSLLVKGSESLFTIAERIDHLSEIIESHLQPLLSKVYFIYFLIHVHASSFKFDSELIKGILHLLHLGVDYLLELTELPRIRLAIVHCRYSSDI
jgi:hypothetical protein